MSAAFLGIDLGGTTVKLGMCDERGTVLGRSVLPTEPAAGAMEAIERIAAAAEALQRTTGAALACGIGLPGLLDRGRTLLYEAVNLPGWTNVEFPRLLGERLGLPTFMENDANCAAWAEYVLGRGRRPHSLVLITLGTGVGGGIVLRDDLWVGYAGRAGRFGHTPIDPDGPPCRCGQRGCLEQYASGSAVARSYGATSAEAVFTAARRGDAAAIRVLDRACDALALGIASVAQAIQPEVVVLGGGMAGGGDLLLDRVRAGVRARIPEHSWKNLRIELSSVGPDAGWIGAALWAARKAGAQPSVLPEVEHGDQA